MFYESAVRAFHHFSTILKVVKGKAAVQICQNQLPKDMSETQPVILFNPIGSGLFGRPLPRRSAHGGSV